MMTKKQNRGLTMRGGVIATATMKGQAITRLMKNHIHAAVSLLKTRFPRIMLKHFFSLKMRKLRMQYLSR